VPVTIALVALNVLVFASGALSGVPLLDPSPDALGPWGANIGPLTADGQAWRTVSSAFVHFGLVHLVVNMIALADLGRVAERLFGSGAFLLIAVASGAVGAAVSVAWNPWVHSAGASGAVFGVLGALLAYALRPATRVPAGVLRTQAIVVAAFVLFTVVIGFTGTGIDHAAHAGGFACGALLGAVLARPLDAPHAPLRMALAAGLALAAFGASMALWRNVGPAYAEERRFVAETRTYLAAEAERVAAMRESFRRWRAGEIPRAAHVEDLLAYAATLRETATRLERHTLSSDSPTAPIAARDALVGVLRLRAQGIEQRAVAVSRGSQSAADEADRLLAEADTLWKRASCGEPRSPLLRCVPRDPKPAMPGG
jgi:rhomboid protease GluP